MIEFNRHFKPEEQDIHLKEELIQPDNLKGIFMWLIRGYIRYKEHGLTMASHLRQVVTNYEQDNDVVLQFLEQRCERGRDKTIKAKDLFQAYKIWTKSEGEYLMSSKMFNAELERHPEWFDEKIVVDGFINYVGLQLKEVI